MTSIKTHINDATNPWRLLLVISAYAAILSVAIMPISMVAYMIWPPFPENLFEIIMDNKFAGLISLDFIYFVGCFFSIPIYLALFVTLFKTNKSLTVLALIFGMIGFVALINARPTLEVIDIVDQYKIAESEVQKSQLKISFDALLTYFHGTSFLVHYILGTVSLTLSSIVMLKSDLYSKMMAYIGIATNLIAFAYYIPVIGVYLSLLSVVGYAVWWIQLALKFKKISNADTAVMGI